jgi:hypothetical protein
MITRTIAILSLSAFLSGCIATPRIEIVEKIDFNYVAPDQKPMSYNDLLCCYDCHA